MSDPVSNADIEDVLSSIRRLVSEEPAASSARRAAPADEVERFVLTPAFRIAEPEETPEPEAAQPEDHGAGADGPEENGEAQADLQPADDAEVEDSSGLQDPAPVVEVEESEETAEEFLHAAQPEPQISEAFDGGEDWSEPSQPSGPRTEEDTAATPVVTVEEPEFAHQPQDRQTLEQRIAELEAAIEMSPQEWEPDGSEDGSSDETRPLSFDTQNQGEDLAEAISHEPDGVSPDEQAVDQGQDPEEEQAELQEGEAGFFHDLSDIEAAVADGADDLGPEEQAEEPPEVHETADVTVEDGDSSLQESVVDAQPEAVEWQDIEAEDDQHFDAALQEDEQEAASAEALRAWQDSPIENATQVDTEAPEESAAQDDDETQVVEEATLEEDDVSEGGNFLADDEAMLDEDTLREMVGDLVREELQGVLGERITRNVRRLVRREIQRALAMRDLE